jgi:hypothetical protein
MRRLMKVFGLVAGIVLASPALAVGHPHDDLCPKRAAIPPYFNPFSSWESFHGLFGSQNQGLENESSRVSCPDVQAYARLYHGEAPPPCEDRDGTTVIFERTQDGAIRACRGGDNLGVENDEKGVQHFRRFENCFEFRIE